MLVHHRVLPPPPPLRILLGVPNGLFITIYTPGHGWREIMWNKVSCVREQHNMAKNKASDQMSDVQNVVHWDSSGKGLIQW